MRKEDDLIIDEEFIDRKVNRDINYTVCYILIGIAILGAVFRLMHWPFSGILIASGMAGMVGYLSSTTIFIKSRKKMIGVIGLAVGTTLLFFGYFGLHEFSITYYFTAALLAFFLTLIIKRLRKS